MLNGPNGPARVGPCNVVAVERSDLRIIGMCQLIWAVVTSMLSVDAGREATLGKVYFFVSKLYLLASKLHIGASCLQLHFTGVNLLGHPILRVL